MLFSREVNAQCNRTLVVRAASRTGPRIISLWVDDKLCGEVEFPSEEKELAPIYSSDSGTGCWLGDVWDWRFQGSVFGFQITGSTAQQKAVATAVVTGQQHDQLLSLSDQQRPEHQYLQQDEQQALGPEQERHGATSQQHDKQQHGGAGQQRQEQRRQRAISQEHGISNGAAPTILGFLNRGTNEEGERETFEVCCCEMESQPLLRTFTLVCTAIVRMFRITRR